MEFEQIIKRLDWLDEERRKGKTATASLEQRMSSIESNLNTLSQQIKTLNTDLSRLSSSAARLEQFSELLKQHRNEVSHDIDEIKNQTGKQLMEADKRHRMEIEGLTKTITDVRKGLDPIPDLKKSIQARVDDISRLGKEISSLEQKLSEYIRDEEGIKRSVQLLEQSRQQDTKRFTDLQGEVIAVRKRSDEQRDKFDLINDNVRNLDNRIKELLATETERRQAQINFIEKQSMAQVERDRAWKKWEERYEEFTKQTQNMDAQIQALDATHRTVKRSQELHEELNQRIERRINEITEMQRLAEERLRQEMVTFKADEQKRWTNYTLTQEELSRDYRHDLEKLAERITDLDDTTQTQQDLLQQTSQTTEQQLQELMNWAHEWLTNYERIMGHSRPNR